MDNASENNQETIAKPTTDKPVHETTTATSPSTLILQWLTYAFWGLTILALSILTFIVIFNLMNDSESGSASLYTLAAIIVLLPISLVCDFLYQKREPKKKSGASAAILAIHAVIFALCGIGVLITGLFAVVQLVTDTNSVSATDSAVARLVSSLIVVVLYALVFVRTINPFKQVRFFPKIHAIAMTAVILIFAILAFVGPFATNYKTKTDRFITGNINSVTNAVEDYVALNEKLPETLGQLDTQGDESTQQLIDEELVTYKVDTATTEYFRYQLCVEYVAKDEQRQYNSRNSDTYQTFISTSGHPAGEVCYKLRVQKPVQLNILTPAKPLFD